MKKILLILLCFFSDCVDCMQRLHPLIMAQKQPRRNYGRHAIIYQMNNGIWQETVRIKEATEKKPTRAQLPKPKFKYSTEQEKYVRVKKQTLKQKREIHLNDFQDDRINNFCNCFGERNTFNNSCECIDRSEDKGIFS